MIPPTLQVSLSLFYLKMFMSVLSNLLSAWFAFLLPCYATYKALSRRPLAESDLQKWATYWTVIGAFVAFEYVGEWLISWLPFYWEMKTIFLLFLSLPQFDGSTYIFNTYLHPFFSRNEANLDAGIVAIQKSILNFFQEKLTVLWDALWALSTNRRSSQQSATSGSRNPQLSSFLSPNAWRSAFQVLQPTSGSGTASRGVDPNTPNGVESSRLSSVQKESPPPFPVPQHYD